MTSERAAMLPGAMRMSRTSAPPPAPVETTSHSMRMSRTTMEQRLENAPSTQESAERGAQNP